MGFGELVIIAVIALLVAGPERLPQMLRTVGVWVNKIRRVVGNVKSEIEREIAAEELKRSLEESKALIAELKAKAGDAVTSDIPEDTDIEHDEPSPKKLPQQDKPRADDKKDSHQKAES